MGDRDALIVICWAAILILIFFECFYRKLKSRIGRDIQPPQGFSSLQTTEDHGSSDSSSSTLAQLGIMDCGGCGGRGSESRSGSSPPRYSHCLGRRSQTQSRYSFSPLPFQNFVKLVSHTKIELEGGEEPPPTYEEALSYAKLVKIAECNPYGFDKWEDQNDQVKVGRDSKIQETSAEPLGGNVESDLEDYTSDESDSEQEVDFNNNKNYGRMEDLPIRNTRILSSSISKVSESSPIPIPTIVTNLESVV